MQQETQVNFFFGLNEKSKLTKKQRKTNNTQNTQRIKIIIVFKSTRLNG